MNQPDIWSSWSVVATAAPVFWRPLEAVCASPCLRDPTTPGPSIQTVTLVLAYVYDNYLYIKFCTSDVKLFISNILKSYTICVILYYCLLHSIQNRVHQGIVNCANGRGWLRSSPKLMKRVKCHHEELNIQTLYMRFKNLDGDWQIQLVAAKQLTKLTLYRGLCQPQSPHLNFLSCSIRLGWRYAVSYGTPREGPENAAEEVVIHQLLSNCG